MIVQAGGCRTALDLAKRSWLGNLPLAVPSQHTVQEGPHHSLSAAALRVLADAADAETAADSADACALVCVGGRMSMAVL